MSGSMQGPVGEVSLRRGGGTRDPYSRAVHSRPAAGAAAQRERLKLLADAINTQILPRLVAGHAEAGPRAARQAPPGAGVDRRDAVALALSVLTDDVAVVRARVMAAAATMGIDALCLDLLAPAACHLGDMWLDDTASFSDVTIGLMRLQSALLHVAGAPGAGAAKSPLHTALLAPVPGEQHTFGLTIVAQFLERAGWAVTMLQDNAGEAVAAALGAGWYGVLGLSAGSTVKLGTLPGMLRQYRRISRNPDLGILVGGSVFVAEPGLAAEIGADSTASDGPRAVAAAESLIRPRRLQRTANG